MKFSLKTLAAAVALATVAAGANATMSNASTAKDGSLVMFAYSVSSGGITGMFDLGLTIDQVIPSANVINSAFTKDIGNTNEIVWNFNTNTVGGSYGSSAAYVGAKTGSWSSQYADWMADMGGATDIRYAVIAASKESAADIRALSTTSAAASVVAQQNKTKASTFATTFDNFIAPHNNIGSHVGNLDGGSSSLDGSASALKAGVSFGAGMNWLTQSSFNATAATGTAMSFFYIDTTNGASTLARTKQFVNSDAPTEIATFNFNAAAGTLTYNVAAVPEPESYAMFQAGLGMLAAVARRRRSN